MSLKKATMQKFFNGALAFILVASLSGIFPALAYATNDEAEASKVLATSTDVDDLTNDAYSFATDDAVVLTNTGESAAETLPTAYDLRDPNGDGDRGDSVVTPVKKQHPWGDCWAFSIITASETSILSELGKTYAQTGFDLSELALVNSVYRNGGAPEEVVGSAQAGEGWYNESEDLNAGFELSGLFTYGVSMFAAGIGPVYEALSPYKNKENLKQCKVTEKGSTEEKTLYLYDDQIKEYQEAEAKVEVVCYAGTYRDSDGTYHYPDWSSNDSLWGTSLLNFENGNILPETRVLDEKDKYVKTDMTAVTAIKNEMYSYGRAVSMAYCADRSTVNEEGLSDYFDYNTWSHYTNQTDASSHAVTIVGWDDSYSAGKFKNKKGKTPEGDGAWLVKNSWGSETEEFPNSGDWGIVENGQHTGYFWLSYYDQSIRRFESYDFDVSSLNNNTEQYTDQYDYLPQREIVSTSADNSFDSPVSSANIFTAQGDMTLSSVGCLTFKPNTTVTYQVYLLDDEASSPTDAEHSKLACTFDETYEYGGYHRSKMDSANWVAMREGQRYAIVTTQKCNDDGKWYQGAGANYAFRFHAKVNAGESWMGTSQGSESKASEQTQWSDWKNVIASMKKESYAIDNVCIKGFSQESSWASVDELRSLEQAIAKAKEVLNKAKISADGSDVATTDIWMTQEEYDALASAVAQAEAVLARAGADYEHELATTTPTSEEAQSAIASLGAEAHEGLIVVDDSSAGANVAGNSAKTGDSSMGTLIALLGVAGIAGLVCVASVVRSRFGRD